MSKKRRYLPVCCLKCGHEWEPRSTRPRQCPKCGARTWDVPPQEQTEGPPNINIEAVEETKQGYLAAVIKRARNSIKGRRAPGRRTKISEDHPEIYSLATTILPRTPILAILIAIVYSAISSMEVGNMWFVLDWYEATWILPQIVGIFTYPAGPGQWFVDYWPLLVLMIMLAVSVLIFVWALPWRVAFKDYVIIRGNTRARDGRVMWSTMNIWTRLWDRIYGTAPRTKVDIWLKTKFWWNPLIPSKGLLRLTLDREVERPEYNGIFTIEARERRYRQYVGHDHMITTDDAQQSRPIPLAHINSNFHSRGQRLVRDTQKFSLANPTVRLEKLRGGTHIVPQDLREAADVARSKRGE